MTDFFKPEARFFESKVALVKPYALMDLDDTLFQTQRKIAAWQLPMDGLVAATVDKQNAPLSFLTPKQRHFLIGYTNQLSSSPSPQEIPLRLCASNCRLIVGKF